MELFPSRSSFQKIGLSGLAAAMLVLSGCGGVTPSKTATGAGVGGAAGAVGGAVIGNNSSLGTGTGAAIGAGAGALVGGIIGMVQDAKDRKEQDRLAQERAYQQDVAKRRTEEARKKAEAEEEIAIAQGFRITDIELADAQKKRESAEAQLKRLRDEKAAALARKKTLDSDREKTLQTEAEIAKLEEDLTRLKGDAMPAQTKPDAKPAANSGGAPETGAPKPGN